MSATTVVMRTVRAAKGCTSEETGARCPCPQFVLGGKEIRFVCVNCGHVEAEHAPCSLTKEDLLSAPPHLVPNGRCSGCGLDVGTHRDEVISLRIVVPAGRIVTGMRKAIYTGLHGKASFCKKDPDAVPRLHDASIDAVVFVRRQHLDEVVANVRAALSVNGERFGNCQMESDAPPPVDTLAIIHSGMYKPSPASHPSLAMSPTDAQAGDGAPVLESNRFIIERVHIVPLTRTVTALHHHKNAIVFADALLNRASEGHNPSGVPTCDFETAADGTFAVLFRTYEDAVATKFRPPDGTVETREGVSVRYTLADCIPVARIAEYQAACALRNRVVRRLWALLASGVIYRLPWNTWLFTASSEAFPVGVALPGGLSIGDRVVTAWHFVQRQDAVHRWAGVVRAVIVAGCVLVAYDRDETGDPAVIADCPLTENLRDAWLPVPNAGVVFVEVARDTTSMDD